MTPQCRALLDRLECAPATSDQLREEFGPRWLIHLQELRKHGYEVRLRRDKRSYERVRSADTSDLQASDFVGLG